MNIEWEYDRDLLKKKVKKLNKHLIDLHNQIWIDEKIFPECFFAYRYQHFGTFYFLSISKEMNKKISIFVKSEFYQRLVQDMKDEIFKYLFKEILIFIQITFYLNMKPLNTKVVKKNINNDLFQYLKYQDLRIYFFNYFEKKNLEQGEWQDDD